MESRSQEAARQVLNGYGGIVLADWYGAYDALARAGPRFTLADGWAHVRRKFVEAEPHYPAPCGEALALLGRLYAVERACPRLDGALDNVSCAEALRLRAALRAEQSAPIIAELRAWAHRQRALPESSLGKAIAYMLGLWPGLTRFLEDPRIPLDNNATERGLRGVVVGRQNHYGSRSKRGTDVATLFLQPDRVREALQRGTEGVPAPGHARGTRQSRERHAPPRSPVVLERNRSREADVRLPG